MNPSDTTTNSSADTTTKSKRWQPPPLHPSRADATESTNTSKAKSDLNTDIFKDEEQFDHIPAVGTDLKNPAFDQATSDVKSGKAPERGGTMNQPDRPSTPGKRFFSAYARTLVGLNPVWLAAEALSPSRKPFGQFNKGRKDLYEVVKDLSGGRDVVVVVDEKIRALGRGLGMDKDKVKDKDGQQAEKSGARDVAERTAEVIRAAGENALLVVTSSLSSLQSSIAPSSDKQQQSEGRQADGNALNLEPTLAALKSHLSRAKDTVDTRAALLLLDRSLKHPVLVAGVREFAQTRGIPHADAVLRLASLGVSRILRKFPETEAAATAVGDAAQREGEVRIEEVSAEELEKGASPAEREEAERVGRAGRDTGKEKLNATAREHRVEALGDGPDSDPYEAFRKKNDCVIQ